MTRNTTRIVSDRPASLSALLLAVALFRPASDAVTGNVQALISFPSAVAECRIVDLSADPSLQFLAHGVNSALFPGSNIPAEAGVDLFAMKWRGLER